MPADGLHVVINPDDWWVEAFAFPSMEEAGHAYERVTAILRIADHIDVSLYRVALIGLPLLIMVGRGERDLTYYPQMRLACRSDERILLPVEVELALLERSAKVWATKPGFVERRNINEVVE